MPEVTDDDLGADNWCTTDDVREEFQLEIGNREPDFERRIDQATRAMQARWADATGNPPSDAGDPPPLLRDATAYLAASKAHMAFSQNIANDNDGDDRHVFLEDAADDAFEDWKRQADLEPGDDTDPGSGVGGMSGVIGGTDDTGIHRGGR